MVDQGQNLKTKQKHSNSFNRIFELLKLKAILLNFLD